MSQPSLPGQYGYPPASGHPTGSAGSNGLWTDPRQGYGAYGRPQEGAGAGEPRRVRADSGQIQRI